MRLRSNQTLRVGIHETFIVVCERFLNVQTSKQRGKKLAIGRGLGGRAPSYGTTGTMVNPALGFTAIASSRNNPSGVFKDPRRRYSS